MLRWKPEALLAELISIPYSVLNNYFSKRIFIISEDDTALLLPRPLMC